MSVTDDPAPRLATDSGPFALVPAWVLTSGVSDRAVRLYGLLALRADSDTGECWPSRATLAREAGCSPKSVDRALRELRDVGALSWHARFRGGDGTTPQTSNLFVIHRVKWTQESNPLDTRDQGPLDTRDYPPLDTGDALTRTKSELDPSEPETLALVPDGPPVPSSAVRVAEVFDAWQRATGHRQAKLTRDRRSRIERALRDYPVEDLIDACHGVTMSAFHMGDNDRQTVYDDLSVILKDARNIEKFRDLARGTAPAPLAQTPKNLRGIRQFLEAQEAR